MKISFAKMGAARLMGIGISLLAITGVLSCTGAAIDHAIVVFSVGSVTVERPGATPRAVEIKDRIARGDTVRTGDVSQLTLQIGDATVIKIEPNSTVLVRDLLDPGKTTLELAAGTALSRVQKLRRGAEYAVKTPNMVAACRGTEFSVSYEPGKSVTAVKDGTVVVQRIAAGGPPDERAVTAGKAADVADGIIIREMTEIESLRIDKISGAPRIENAAGKSIPELVDAGTKHREREARIDERIRELAHSGTDKPMSLDQMRAKYQRIDEVTLYNGKTYRGVILSRGDTYRMLTTAGTVSIPASKIRSTKTVR